MLGVDAHAQVPARHAARRLHEPRDRRGNGVGRRQPKPDRAHQHQERGLEVGEEEDDLDLPAVLRGVPVGHQRALGLTQVGDDAGLQGPRDIEVDVRIGPQAVERAHHVGVAEIGHVDLARIGRLEPASRRRHVGRRALALGARQDVAVAVDQIGGGEAVIGGQRGEVAVGAARLRQVRGLAVEVQGHRGEMVLDVVGLLLDVRAEHRGRVLHHGLDAVAEPALHAAVHQHAVEDEDHGSRRDGGQGEQAGEPHLQPRAGILCARVEQLGDSEGDGCDQRQNQDQVQTQDGLDHLADGPQRPGGRWRGGQQDRQAREARGDPVADALHHPRLQHLPGPLHRRVLEHVVCKQRHCGQSLGSCASKSTVTLRPRFSSPRARFAGARLARR